MTLPFQNSIHFLYHFWDISLKACESRLFVVARHILGGGGSQMRYLLLTNFAKIPSVVVFSDIALDLSRNDQIKMPFYM